MTLYNLRIGLVIAALAVAPACGGDSGGDTPAGDGDTGDGDMMGDGDTTPGDGDTTPGDGDTTPGDGDTDPGDGDTDPGDGDTDPGDGDTDPGDGDGDGDVGASELTEEQAIQLCEDFVNGSAMPTSDQTCTVQSAISTDSAEACEEATAACVTAAEEEQDPTMIPEEEDPCAPIVAALTGCSAKVADVEACFSAFAAAQTTVYSETTCEAAGTITADIYAPPADCDAVKTACPALFPEPDPETP